eukprot:scaffold18651_cov28-Cyclotella_meneghiniana.AAC.1
MANLDKAIDVRYGGRSHRAPPRRLVSVPLWRTPNNIWPAGSTAVAKRIGGSHVVKEYRVTL